jgi:hypothetical protein
LVGAGKTHIATALDIQPVAHHRKEVGFFVTLIWSSRSSCQWANNSPQGPSQQIAVGSPPTGGQGP